MTTPPTASSTSSTSGGSRRRDFEARFPFALDDFQRRALDAIDEGASVVVAAPTGSGKTVVAEYAVEAALATGRRAFYTTPIKALSNQKYRDLAASLGSDRVGLLTGDTSINDRAAAVVMTTEVLRNMIYAESPALAGLRTVVLDEVHFLQDPTRGSVWEEVIVHLPLDIDLVCLSATVSNAKEIADWVTTVRGRTVAVIHDVRPIELEHLYAVELRGSDEIVVLPTLVDGRPNDRCSRFDAEDTGSRNRRRSSTPQRVDVLTTLRDADMLPAITFVFSRAGCDEAVRSCWREGLRLTSPRERREIAEVVRSRATALSERDRAALDFDHFLASAQNGYAAHHAGMIPAFRESVEACFTDGLLKAVFATETLAVGVNMPARTVVIEKLTKYTGERHAMLTPAEFTQLTGRAGRRGLDESGSAVVLWNPMIGFDEVAALVRHRTYELRSSFRPTNNMAINLVRNYGPTQARHLLGLSLAQFQIDAASVDLRSRLDRLSAERSAMVADAACELGDVAGYIALRDRRSLRPRSSVEDVTEALKALRPGDVLGPVGEDGSVETESNGSRSTRHGEGWLLVVARSERKGRGPTLRCIGPNGKLVALSAPEFRSCPTVIERVRLPEPFNLQSRSFVAAGSAALERVMQRNGASRSSLRRGRSTTETAAPAVAARASDRRSPWQDHAVASCPELRRHLRSLRRVEELDAEVARVGRLLGARSRSISDQFDRVLDLLGRRGFVDGWKVTETGDLLAAIFHESDLAIAETVRAGILDGLDPAQLAGLVSAFVHEERGPSPRPGNGPGARLRGDLPAGFPKTLAPRLWAMQRVVADVQADEADLLLPITRDVSAGFVAVAQRWASGTPLATVLAEAAGNGPRALTGGDFVRTVKSLIDLLRQLGVAAPDPATRAAAAEAASLLHRGVVAASAVSA